MSGNCQATSLETKGVPSAGNCISDGMGCLMTCCVWGLPRSLVRIKKKVGTFYVYFRKKIMKHSTFQLIVKSMKFYSLYETIELNVSTKFMFNLTFCI